MRVIIAGSRGFDCFDTMLGHMSLLPADFPNEDGTITEIVSGGARGADRLGEDFAKLQFLPVKQFIPDWNGKGKGAGFIRNEEMANYADALIAFWDQKSNGTKHMIDCMRKRNKPVYVFDVRKPQ